MAFAKGELPNYVSVDVVANVKIGTGVIVVLANRIHNKGTVTLEVPANPKLRLQSGGIVERVRPGVVEVQDQAREALAIGNCKSVVVGIADGAPRGQSPILRLHESRVLAVVSQSQIGFGLDIGPVIGFKEVIQLVLPIVGLGIGPSGIVGKPVVVSDNRGHTRREYIVEVLGYLGIDQAGHLADISALLADFLQSGSRCVPVDSSLRIADIVKGCDIAVSQQTPTHPANIRS